MDITLSIIIPYYNAEPYMTELMKVLIPQLTAEVEIIVVDDGSEIPYEAPDERIKVVRQKNKGLAGARNTGLKHSKGKYIAFIDADDLVSGNFVEYILGRSNEKWDYMDLSWKSLEDNRYVYLLKSDSDRLSNPSVCTKVWSRAFIGKQRFNEKKDVAEDEDFTRRIDLSRGKRICAPQFMYFYRVSTPNSLSKQYRSGTTKTKRIVYYFNLIPEDKALLEEVKRESETNEVVIMTTDSNADLQKYASFLRPTGTWADELRGDPTSLVKVREHPEEAQIILFANNLYGIGGIETFIYNFCEIMSKHYDIIVIYDKWVPEQVVRLQKFVRVIKNVPNRHFKCNTLIMNRIFDKVPQNIESKKVIQMVHGCKNDNPWHVPADRPMTVAVSETVKKSFGDELSNTNVINNFYKRNPIKSLFLVSTSRLDTPEKGQKRMIKLARMLEGANIDYIWLYFSNRVLPNAPERMIHMTPTLNIIPFVQRADYLVQLSDSEAFCYSIIEALCEGTAVITTDLPVLSELKFKDKEHGYIVPMNMEFDVSELLTIPTFKYTYNNTPLINKWKKLLGKTDPEYNYKPSNTNKVRVTKRYNDLTLNRYINSGEVITVTPERAVILIKAGVARREAD